MPEEQEIDDGLLYEIKQLNGSDSQPYLKFYALGKELATKYG